MKTGKWKLFVAVTFVAAAVAMPTFAQTKLVQGPAVGYAPVVTPQPSVSLVVFDSNNDLTKVIKIVGYNGPELQKAVNAFLGNIGEDLAAEGIAVKDGEKVVLQFKMYYERREATFTTQQIFRGVALLVQKEGKSLVLANEGDARNGGGSDIAEDMGKKVSAKVAKKIAERIKLALSLSATN